MDFEEQLDELAQLQGFTEVFEEIEQKRKKYEERDLFAWKIILGIPE